MQSGFRFLRGSLFYASFIPFKKRPHFLEAAGGQIIDVTFRLPVVFVQEYFDAKAIHFKLRMGNNSFFTKNDKAGNDFLALSFFSHSSTSVHSTGTSFRFPSHQFSRTNA